MDRRPLRDRYSLAERQATVHGFADSPLTSGQFVRRVREIVDGPTAIRLLGKLEKDEVVLRGPCPGNRTAPLYALVGSLLQPAPHWPDPITPNS